MKKLLISGVAGLLIFGMANANVSTLAVTKNVDSNEFTIPLSLNNQANAQITSTSELIPAEYRMVGAQEAVIFDVQLPAVSGSKRIRYSNDRSGCDFYFDVQSNPMSLNNVYITGVPIDAASMCNVFSAKGVNHLAVSFLKIG